MTEPISVEAPSAEAAQELAGSLAARFPLEISQVNGAWVVAVRPDHATDRVVVDLLCEVERWLVAADVPTTRVRLDGRVYVMERPGLAPA